MREVQKKRLEAKRLGNVPFQEQQRIQQLASEWQLDGITPARLVQVNPQVLTEVMKLAGALSLRLDSADLPPKDGVS